MMRKYIVSAAVMATMIFGGISASQAQGIVSCSDFVKMDQTSQTAAIAEIVNGMSGKDSTSPTVSNDNNGPMLPGVAQVTDGCQNSPTMTANDVVSQIMNTGQSTNNSEGSTNSMTDDMGSDSNSDNSGSDSN